uniref:non-specific serine/threonine protein kinase n=1 Tax=Ganoderma boninense TaxID=34458 RepID=A0A5K1JVH5_9APHY|nr:Non-specific serine/threonine protein kinase (EC [Ganoderma boninense]
MYEEVGERTLYEFDVIDRVKSVVVNLDFSPPASPVLVPVPHEPQPAPVFLHVHEALHSISPACSPDPRPPSPLPHTPTTASPSPHASPSSSPPSPPPLRARHGRVLSAADFRPLRVLGKGGHGTVYLIEDVVSERPFALKVIEKNGLRLREYPPVFEEQAVLRALSSGGAGEQTQPPSIAPLAGSFEDSDNFYFLTVGDAGIQRGNELTDGGYTLQEYYPRGDLMMEMKRNGIVPEHQARLWCAELLVALEHLHKQRIVHRDVKLDNILLDEDNHIALTDFGIARAFARTDADRPWTRLAPWNTPDASRHEECERGDGRRARSKGLEVDETHSLMGTPGYVAPEVYSGSYSTLKRILPKLPFGLQPREQRLEEVISRTDSLPADLDLRGMVEEDARDLLMKMLEKDPKKRPSVRKLKKHRWFRGIKWEAIERREPKTRAYKLPDTEVSVEQECFYIPFGRQYAAHEVVPHEWFEWTSPSLQGGDTTYDTTTDWSLASTCYVDFSQSAEPLRPKEPVTVPNVRKWPTVIERMKGWLRKRGMSIS